MIEPDSYWARFSKRRLSRRTVLRGALVTTGGLAAAAVFGCSDDSSPSTSTGGSSGTPVRGGVLTRKAQFEVQGGQLDPHTIPTTWTQDYKLWYQSLLVQDPLTLDLNGQLAQRWEVVSPTEFVFHLRRGVKWHNKPPVNGRELVANDVVFSMERIRTNNPRFLSRSALVSVDQITAVDPYTVKFTLKTPNASFLTVLSGESIIIMAPEAVQQFDTKFNNPDTVIGTGPFVLADLRERVGSRSVRHPDYWDAGKPYLDEVRTQQFGSDEEAYAAFVAGQVDIVPIPGSHIQEYINKKGKDFKLRYGRGKTAHYTQINMAVAPFNNTNVVRALRLLIDHQEMLDAVGKTFLGGGLHGQLLPISLAPWDLTQQEYETYPEWKPGKDAAIRDALALLSSAGFTAANPLNFELLGRVDTPGDYLTAEVELLHAQWRKNSQGVLRPTLRTVDQATINTVQTNRQYQVMKAGNGGIANDPDSHFSSIVASDGSRNYMGFKDPTLDAMILKQRQEFDVTKRKALVKEINIYLIDKSPITMNLQYLNAPAVSDRVQGYVPEGELPTIYNGDLYDDMWVTG